MTRLCGMSKPRAHERTANAYQRAAVEGLRDHAEELQAEADKHWQAAQEDHLRSIEEQAQADDPGQSSSARGVNG